MAEWCTPDTRNSGQSRVLLRRWVLLCSESRNTGRAGLCVCACTQPFVCVSVFFFVCLSVYLCMFLSVCLPVCVSVCHTECATPAFLVELKLTFWNKLIFWNNKYGLIFTTKLLSHTHKMVTKIQSSPLHINLSTAQPRVWNSSKFVQRNTAPVTSKRSQPRQKVYGP